jgi:hypothetical protein
MVETETFVYIEYVIDKANVHEKLQIGFFA